MYPGASAPEAITYTLVDLMHLCASIDLDFAEFVSLAKLHFGREK
jgi:hypothetical protein